MTFDTVAVSTIIQGAFVTFGPVSGPIRTWRFQHETRMSFAWITVGAFPAIKVPVDMDR